MLELNRFFKFIESGYCEPPTAPYLLKSTIDSILIESQSAFLEGRCLSDMEIIEAIPYDTHFKENLVKTILDVGTPYIFRKQNESIV